MLVKVEMRRSSEKAFFNGDFYIGEFKGLLPHGRGKYTWSDGTVYEGDWEEGKISGKGKFMWSTGAKYEGDVSGGYLHGFGTLTSPDGSIYTGAWRMNVRHGLGRKEYSNSDVYNGSWKEGVRDGIGSYSWNSGNRYVGNWKLGKMCGGGVIRWANGDLFDGLWFNGFRQGSGLYKFADGGFYFGTWANGLKDGKGIFYPAGSKHPSIETWRRSLVYDDTGNFVLSRSSSITVEELGSPKTVVTRSLSEKSSSDGMMRNSGSISDRLLDEMWSPRDDASTLGQSEGQDKNPVVFEREYVQGVLSKERVTNYAEMLRKAKPLNRAKELKTSTCLTIFGDKQSYYLMLNLQLGIRYSVGKITPMTMREVRASDFGDRARLRMFFAREGSQFTPPRKSIDFYWKDYCPIVFRNLRLMFELDAADYMMSICGDDGLREIASPGKSGSIFYLSHDDRFLIKTLQKSELKVLLEMLPSYYEHVRKHENTLITKFFGVYSMKVKWGEKVRFVVMGNVFCTELKIHRRYDLKGSTQGRFTEENVIDEKTTLKDLDLVYVCHMDKQLREALFKQIHLDCLFLESQHIIDYSLLLGFHFRAPAPEHYKDILEPLNSSSDQDRVAFMDGVSSQDFSIPPKGMFLVAHEPGSVSTEPGPHIRGSTLRAFSVGEREADVILPGTARLRVQLGVNMPAQANRKLLREENKSTAVELFEAYDVVLYMGIIDILQEYNIMKKLEYRGKSLQYDPMSISTVEPKRYANRFMGFLKRIFPEET